MERKKIRSVLFAMFCVIISASAACGKKTVNPPERPEMSESAQESQEETGQETEGSTEADSGGDQLAGGSAGDVTYEVKHLEKQYMAEDGTAIFEVKLAYPVLQNNGEEKNGTAVINQYFVNWAQKKLLEYETDQDSMRQSALEVYRESKDAGWPGPWGENYEVTSVKTWGGYLSVLMDSYLDEGGAHGTPYREGRVFRLADGHEVELSDLTDRDQGEWEKILRSRFSSLIAEGEEGEYYEDALDLIKERDMSDIGYYFTDSGIAFYLPPYEIAPYSRGYAEVIVPFEEAGLSAFHADE